MDQRRPYSLPSGKMTLPTRRKRRWIWARGKHRPLKNI
jgi:hypothetical protein